MAEADANPTTTRWQGLVHRGSLIENGLGDSLIDNGRSAAEGPQVLLWCRMPGDLGAVVPFYKAETPVDCATCIVTEHAW